jgi:hypothetical protein
MNFNLNNIQYQFPIQFYGSTFLSKSYLVYSSIDNKWYIFYFLFCLSQIH